MREADLPLPTAGAADLGRGAGLLTRAVARLAGLVPRDLDLGLGSGGRLLERDLEPVLEVGAPSRPAASAPATPSSEKSLEEIFEDGAEACLEPGGRCPHAAEPIILRALVGVGEHGVGLADFLEARLRGGIAGVLVGVELPGEVAIGLLELGVLGVAPDAEDGVVVLGRH